MATPLLRKRSGPWPLATALCCNSGVTTLEDVDINNTTVQVGVYISQLYKETAYIHYCILYTSHEYNTENPEQPSLYNIYIILASHCRIFNLLFTPCIMSRISIKPEELSFSFLVNQTLLRSDSSPLFRPEDRVLARFAFSQETGRKRGKYINLYRPSVHCPKRNSNFRYII